MNIYPANEWQISEVERGRCSELVVSIPDGHSLVAGDSVLFALSLSRPGQEVTFVKGGDSVLVSITAAVDTGSLDPSTGQSLFRLTWQPLGLAIRENNPAPNDKSRRPRGINRANDGRVR